MKNYHMNRSQANEISPGEELRKMHTSFGNTLEVFRSIKKLIRSSCNEMELYKQYNSFDNVSIAVLKKYFNAKDVRINQIEKKIELDIDTSTKKFSFNVSQIVKVDMEYTDLREFVCSCLEEDSKSLMFYRNLIRYQRSETSTAK